MIHTLPTFDCDRLLASFLRVRSREVQLLDAGAGTGAAFVTLILSLLTKQAQVQQITTQAERLSDMETRLKRLEALAIRRHSRR